VTEGDGAAVDVHEVGGDAEVAGGGEGYAGKGLADLDQGQALDPEVSSRRKASLMALAGWSMREKSGPATVP
jgi:hypothetical protein